MDSVYYLFLQKHSDEVISGWVASVMKNTLKHMRMDFVAANDLSSRERARVDVTHVSRSVTLIVLANVRVIQCECS
jgi:hypothetical protein